MSNGGVTATSCRLFPATLRLERDVVPLDFDPTSRREPGPFALDLDERFLLVDGGAAMRTCLVGPAEGVDARRAA